MMTMPKNEPIKPDITPHNFFIWGATMSGKSYLAEHFPDLLVLSTDRNYKAGTRPGLYIGNEFDTKGNLKSSVIDQFQEILRALKVNKEGYKSVSIDVVEDVLDRITRALCVKEGVPTLADFKGFNRGYTLLDMTFKALIEDLRSLPMNVIFISRELDDKDDSNKKHPGIKNKYYNIVTGNCDVSVHTQQVSGHYYRSVDKIRRKYYASQIQDPELLHVLKNIPGALSPEPQQTKAGK